MTEKQAKELIKKLDDFGQMAQVMANLCFDTKRELESVYFPAPKGGKKKKEVLTPEQKAKIAITVQKHISKLPFNKK